MAVRITTTPAQWLQIVATIVFAGTLALLMIIGIRRADQLQALSSALQRSSELSARPTLVRSELTLMQRGLETTTYIGESLRNIASARDSGNQAFSQLQTDLANAQLLGDAQVSGRLDAAARGWRSLDRGLALLNRPASELYADSAAGSELTASGRQMKAAVDQLLSSQSKNLQTISTELTALSGSLRSAVADGGRRLRTLLLGGTAVATLLLALMLYYAWRSRQSALAAASAQRQVSNILGTVREGLFLIGRDLKLRETYSASLCSLLRIDSPSGLTFEQLLQPLVDQKTLLGAVKFLGLLWRDKVHEELIESVNPLSQIEISFSGDHGGSDVRYMAFTFRRVRGSEAAADYILGAVADITDKVLLARELEQLKSESDSQSALLLQLLRVDPTQLASFLSSSDVAFRKSNAMFTAPGIEPEELQKKLNGVFRELHAVKGEAAALTLSGFVERIHAIEDTLAGLRRKPALGGNDFLPVVLKLDDLMSHLQLLRSLQDRVNALHTSGAEPVAADDVDGHRDTTVITETIELEPPPAAAQHAASLLDLLRSMTAEVARACARSVRLVARGLDDIPPHYVATVKDICIQMIRNSVVHGIEASPQRRQHGKAEEGTILISFATDNADEFLLTVEDDGGGLNYEQIIDHALRQGLVRPQQAATLERAAVYRLIFQPGFSTAATVSEHAGRGVGLDAVGALVREAGGKIGVATVAGHYTRFKVLLPKAFAAQAAASSAA